MRLATIYLFLLLVVAGCSSVDVKVDSDDQDKHEQIFSEEMKGRSADYVQPRLLELPPVAYPTETSDLNMSGLVMVKVMVGYDGQVVEAEVTQGLHPDVDQAALAAARGGRYAPATEYGNATDGWITVPFRFPPESGEAE